MIFITGDTHGYITSEVLFKIKEDYPNLTKNDYVIVAGDFGGCWNEELLEKTKKIMKDLPYTLLFVDGNHENFDILNSYKVEAWNGGRVHKLFDDVIHLMRGEVFTIEGKVILTLGGADSDDKCRRVEHISWWEDERITFEDVENAKKNLARVNNEVDYVITHTCPAKVLYQTSLYVLCYGVPKISEANLQDIYDILKFKKWFFGHWHFDEDLKNNFYCVYREYKVL